MHNQTILANIQKVVDLTDEEKLFFLNNIQIIHLKRKARLKPSTQDGYIAFLMSGGVKYFIEAQQETEEVVIDFIRPNSWIIHYGNNQMIGKDQTQIQALVDSELMLVNYDNLESYFSRVPKLEKFFRLKLWQIQEEYVKNLIQMKTLDADDRYDTFCEDYKELVADIPQKAVASFIGVTPQFFSKMKKM